MKLDYPNPQNTAQMTVVRPRRFNRRVPRPNRRQRQQLNGFDLDSLLSSSKSLLTNLTGGTTAAKSTGVPALLARPINANTAPTVTQQTPVATKSLMTTITDGFKQLAPIITTGAGMAISLEMQKKLAKHNVELVKNGQQPVDMQSFMSANAPVVRVEGGVDNNTSKNLMYGGIAIGAVLLVIAMRKK